MGGRVSLLIGQMVIGQQTLHRARSIIYLYISSGTEKILYHFYHITGVTIKTNIQTDRFTIVNTHTWNTESKHTQIFIAIHTCMQHREINAN
jgi:CRISPR/Cas system endoribonuclease Cas6 (RAMP superfamily)